MSEKQYGPPPIFNIVDTLTGTSVVSGIYDIKETMSYFRDGASLKYYQGVGHFDKTNQPVFWCDRLVDGQGVVWNVTFDHGLCAPKLENLTLDKDGFRVGYCLPVYDVKHMKIVGNIHMFEEVIKERVRMALNEF